MKNRTTFSKVSGSEAETISRLAREIWPAVYADMISREQIDYMLEWMYDPAVVREEIEKQKIVYLLLNHEDQTAGFTAFGPLPRGHSCKIHKIYVKPEFHRRGIAADTMREIESYATAAGVSDLELRVNRGNDRAINFYEKAGFTKTGEDCADIGGGFVMDDFIFRKALA